MGDQEASADYGALRDTMARHLAICRMGKLMRIITLPRLEWVPGTLVVEYVRQRLSGDYSQKSILDLLSSAVNNNEIQFRHKHIFAEEDFLHAEINGNADLVESRRFRVELTRYCKMDKNNHDIFRHG